jgi:Putative redox-active protein (C_GCAxxG_C_C)
VASSPMHVREEYRGLSGQELLDRAYELGAEYERTAHGCSQCTVAALHDLLGLDGGLVRAATSSCGGQALRGEGTCGAVIGGTMVVDWFCGRPADRIADVGALRGAVAVAGRLGDRFEQAYGSILCPRIQERLYGRSFSLRDPEEFAAFERAGAHSDPSKCLDVVGNAARWTLEILLDEGAVELAGTEG